MSESFYWKEEAYVLKTENMLEKCYQMLITITLRVTGILFYDKSKPNHFFYDNVHLSQIVRNFEFDNSLRIIVFDAISRIEKSVRTRFIYGLALKYGPFPFEYSS